jgi:hypothetical protein
VYYLNLNGEQAGPFTRRQLKAMWLSGGITVNTEWRETNSISADKWIDGSVLPELLENTFTGDDLVERRSRLRMTTGYPKLRQALQILAVLDLVYAVIALFMVFYDSERASLYGLIAVASIISVVPLALGNVVIDLADAALKTL